MRHQFAKHLTRMNQKWYRDAWHAHKAWADMFDIHDEQGDSSCKPMHHHLKDTFLHNHLVILAVDGCDSEVDVVRYRKWFGMSSEWLRNGLVRVSGAKKHQGSGLEWIWNDTLTPMVS